MSDEPPKVARCPACGGAPRETVVTREMMFGLREPFVYRRCADCRSLWLETVPLDLARFYGAGYYSMTPQPHAAPPGAALWIRALMRLPAAATERLAGRKGFPEYLTWFPGTGVGLDSRIADVGSGEGAWLLRLAAHGFTNLWGFDPFVSRDKDYERVHIRRGGVETAEGDFDLVMFNHSLEHVPDPLAALVAAGGKTRPDARVLVRIPLAGTYADREYGPDWVSLDPPRHLWVPTREGMERLVERAGMRITRVFYDSKPLQIWASEHYRLDIPLESEESKARLTPERMKALRRRARELNRAQDGDNAGFVLAPV